MSFRVKKKRAEIFPPFSRFYSSVASSVSLIAMPSSSSCFSSTTPGASVIGQDASFTLGKAITVTNTGCIAHQHDDSVQTERQAAMRGYAVFEGIQKEAEAFMRILVAEAKQLEHLLLDISAVDSDGAAAQLIAVQNEYRMPLHAQRRDWCQSAPSPHPWVQ